MLGYLLAGAVGYIIGEDSSSCSHSSYNRGIEAERRRVRDEEVARQNEEVSKENTRRFKELVSSVRRDLGTEESPHFLDEDDDIRFTSTVIGTTDLGERYQFSFTIWKSSPIAVEFSSHKSDPRLAEAVVKKVKALPFDVSMRINKPKRIIQ